MKNKYLPLLAAVSFALVCANSSFASMTVTLTQNTHAYSGANGGGEFKAVTSDNGTFQTFCIDVNDSFTSGKTYNYKISQQTYAGSGNNISIGTAWLYSQFLDQTLNGYNFNDGSGNVASATLLQNTLWALEGEISSKGILTGKHINNIFYTDLINQFGSIAAAEKDAGADNIYGVAVMNLYSIRNGQTTLAQSQLVRVPTCPPPVSVPEPSTIVAGALLLLPLGVSALKILRRKQATVS
jgi:hypothetical protein